MLWEYYISRQKVIVMILKINKYYFIIFYYTNKRNMARILRRYAVYEPFLTTEPTTITVPTRVFQALAFSTQYPNGHSVQAWSLRSNVPTARSAILHPRRTWCTLLHRCGAGCETCGKVYSAVSEKCGNAKHKTSAQCSKENRSGNNYCRADRVSALQELSA